MAITQYVVSVAGQVSCGSMLWGRERNWIIRKENVDTKPKKMLFVLRILIFLFDSWHFSKPNII